MTDEQPINNAGGGGGDDLGFRAESRIGFAHEITNWKRTDPAHAANLGFFFIKALSPQHPVWDSYMLSAVHLREIEGVAEGVNFKRHYPEAEYEIALLALNPTFHPDPKKLESMQAMTPAQAVVQFHFGLDDDELADKKARELAELVVQSTLDGVMPLEPSDYLAGHQLWERSLKETARCLANPGGHDAEQEERKKRAAQSVSGGRSSPPSGGPGSSEVTGGSVGRFVDELETMKAQLSRSCEVALETENSGSMSYEQAHEIFQVLVAVNNRSAALAAACSAVMGSWNDVAEKSRKKGGESSDGGQ